MAYVENNPEFAKFEKVDDFIEGVLLKIQSSKGPSKSSLYTLMTSEGKPINVWGSTVLDQKMSGIREGDKIKIVYKGLGAQKAGKNAPKLFQVFIDKQ